MTYCIAQQKREDCPALGVRSQRLLGPPCRKPYHGVNFVIAHDGFTLHDLVAYNEKHNDANGEQNRDGSNDNFSWNCGAEGPTDAVHVLALRQRQMRNLMLALLVAQGTPMVLSGAPCYGHLWAILSWPLSVRSCCCDPCNPSSCAWTSALASQGHHGTARTFPSVAGLLWQCSCRCETIAGGPTGDEYAQTRGGNNNWYGHDTKMTRFEWNELEAVRSSFFRFYRSVSAFLILPWDRTSLRTVGGCPCSKLIHFRRAHPLLGRAEFLTSEDISWYDEDWANPESRFLAFTLHDRSCFPASIWSLDFSCVCGTAPLGIYFRAAQQIIGSALITRRSKLLTSCIPARGQGCGSLFVAFNAHAFSVMANLPGLPEGQVWSRVVDTNLEPPKDFTEGGNSGVEPSYIVSAFSSIMLMTKQSS